MFQTTWQFSPIEAFILLVLLTSWLPEAGLDNPLNQYDTVEMFAGVGMVSQVCRLAGKRCAAIDIDYEKTTARKGSMDFCTDSGMVFLYKQLG